MGAKINNKVTAIIKTFERPHCLNKLIKSIKKYYPNLPIIVADDSKKPIVRKDVDHMIVVFHMDAIFWSSRL